jgi:hypothetical protein
MQGQQGPVRSCRQADPSPARHRPGAWAALGRSPGPDPGEVVASPALSAVLPGCRPFGLRFGLVRELFAAEPAPRRGSLCRRPSPRPCRAGKRGGAREGRQSPSRSCARRCPWVPGWHRWLRRAALPRTLVVTRQREGCFRPADRRLRVQDAGGLGQPRPSWFRRRPGRGDGGGPESLPPPRSRSWCVPPRGAGRR